MKTKNGDIVPLGMPAAKPSGARDGGLRSWAEIAQILHERGEPLMCPQSIRNTHDAALLKLRSALLQDREGLLRQSSEDDDD